jgi:hypothetical protein
MIDFIAHGLFTDPQLDPEYLRQVSEGDHRKTLFPGAPELQHR